MKKVLCLLLASVMSIALASCGGSTEGSKDASTQISSASTSASAGQTSDTPEPAPADTLPVSEHEETGNGTFYVTTPSGTSEDGNVPILYFGEDDFLVSIGMEAWDFDGSKLTYIYLNGKEIETDQLADTQSSIGIEQDDIQEGENTVVAVQYDNDDPSGEIVTYKTATFEVRMK